MVALLSSVHTKLSVPAVLSKLLGGVVVLMIPILDHEPKARGAVPDIEVVLSLIRP
jgi:hypothetical protein